jgi:hypothetical protein
VVFVNAKSDGIPYFRGIVARILDVNVGRRTDFVGVRAVLECRRGWGYVFCTTSLYPSKVRDGDAGLGPERIATIPLFPAPE